MDLKIRVYLVLLVLGIALHHVQGKCQNTYSPHCAPNISYGPIWENLSAHQDIL